MATKRNGFGKKGVSRPPPAILNAPSGLSGAPPVRTPARKASVTVALFAVGAAAMAGGVAWMSREDPACRVDPPPPGGRPANCSARTSSSSHGGSSGRSWFFSSGSSSSSSGHATTASPSGGHGSFGGFGATGAGHSGGGHSSGS